MADYKEAWGRLSQAKPIRTCVATRQRRPHTDLLRMVIAPQGNRRIVPDPQCVLPGRGAWIIPDLEALELAQKRRAIQRALKVPVDTDTSEVHAYLEGRLAMPGTSTVRGTERIQGKKTEH
ncbi:MULTISPECIES: YlxR family protein [unclassified Corynebacterium]|uniref:YlxR family protein n=1 Tax=unclassified Corynebacterium TaxID=2624378 RepID=UPI0029CA02C8|nr:MULTISPECIES: YlxR family protein [unclassified Corynebacterium]WPF65293.1 YlxR family protein [Corynebacterium sp. 22KM0430]WPF67788.1 YlxR family protein [Corynebacterium sp. 21KM1197]